MVAPSWTKARPQTMIGVLHTGTVSTDWALAFSGLDRPPGTLLSFSSHWPFDVSRNAICRAALDKGADWLLFLDSDVLPAPDALTRLKSHDLPIVQGVYHTKVPPHPPLVMRRQTEKAEDGTEQRVFKNLAEWTPGEVLEVDTVATGLLLLHRRVLEAFESKDLPWFEWTMGRKQRLVERLGLDDIDIEVLQALVQLGGRKDKPRGVDQVAKILERIDLDEPVEGLSEDFMFGVRAKKLGFPLYVDTGVVAPHVMQSRIVGTNQVAGMSTP